ncbi:hypothetical protein HPB52_012901 [Rhipicephalus sanguineus]|uniref:Uncharacterized protein n=1 Tax=Rhipicephalus sanguineus TaxID=34632 RepID=A0A9D4QDI4_RHISA|nr:hypothetical protein HPB52_012901 [Rhipicephalus sanguineus]
MDLLAHPFFGAVMDLRGRGFRFAFFLGALAASVAMAVHGAPRHDNTMAGILKDLENCGTVSATATTGGPTVVGRGGVIVNNATHHRHDAVHKRALCPSRPSFDYNHLRIPENLTTVECLCQDKLCLPLNDYRCTAVRYEFPVEYKNGTTGKVTLTVACVCAKRLSANAYTGIVRTV